jgi:ABC-type glycerol-3-phosphate transport system substrate-binding protein
VWDDRTLAWPVANSAAAWFYNLDALKNGGIESPPATWDEVEAAAQAIEQGSGTPGWVLRNDTGPWFMVVLWTYGVPWLSEDGLSTTFDSDTSIRVLTKLRQMADDGTLAVSDTAVEDFIAGRAPMTMLSSGFIGRFSSEITGFEWGVSILPSGDGADPITEMFGTVHAMVKGTPGQQAAAWTFMKYMNSPAVQAQFAASTGFFPSTKSSEQLPALQEFSATVPQFKAAVDSIAPAMQLLPQSPALGEIRNQIATDVITQLLLGQLSPEEAAAKLKFDSDKALQAAQ